MKWRITAAILSAITITAFAGAISGTLAWYAYVTQASVSYGGTSVYSTSQLQIGLKTDKTISLVDAFDEKYTLDPAESTSGVSYYTLNASANETYTEVIETENEKYWFAKGGNGLGEKDILTYLKATDPTHMMQGNTTTLIPCTTRKYSDGDDFKLYQNPSKLEYDHGEASKNCYSKIDFAFRVCTSDDNHVKNQNIWLMNADESVQGSAGPALRLYFEGNDNSEGNPKRKVLFNPSSKDDGQTTTAGLLDLDNDGYYDYTITDYDQGTGKEYLYGIDGTTPDQTISSEELDNINQVEDTTSGHSSFYARHKSGNTGYLNYDGLDLPKAEYKGTDSVYPSDDSGKLDGGTIMTTTGNDDLAIGDLSMTIYMEGWDHSIIDKNIDYTFQLGLTFQINKVE